VQQWGEMQCCARAAAHNKGRLSSGAERTRSHEPAPCPSAPQVPQVQPAPTASAARPPGPKLRPTAHQSALQRPAKGQLQPQQLHQPQQQATSHDQVAK